MKKLIAGLVFLAAVAGCHSAPPPPPSPSAPPVTGSNVSGAPDATSAVRMYLKSVEQRDLQAMGSVWGGPDGPARDLLPREELFQREMVMICTLKHDRYDIVGEAPTGSSGHAIIVNLFANGDSRPRIFDVVQGPASRWYVKSVDVKTLTSCGKG
ncbi:MAG TPA: hypothetical protein VH277_18305 [Gemmatimonadaceae bacterium]|nr:hypothetical protein [Gemmatimonadaceae bacterium]